MTKPVELRGTFIKINLHGVPAYVTMSTLRALANGDLPYSRRDEQGAGSGSANR